MELLAELVDWLLLEGMAHQFVVMSMFGREVGTVVGLQRAEDIFGDVVWGCLSFGWLGVGEVLARVGAGVRSCAERKCRGFRWNSLFETRPNVINVKAAVARVRSSGEEDSSQSELASRRACGG